MDSSATSLNGYSVNVQLAKQSGKHWRGQLGSAMTAPKYEVNDLGFSYRTPILSYLSVTPNAQTLNYWALSTQATPFFRAYDDRLTRGGPMAIPPAWWYGGVNVTSDVRKPVTASLSMTGDKFESGSWDWSVGLGAAIKKSKRWNVSLRPTVARRHTEAQFVTRVAEASYTATYGQRYVFAPLDQTSVGLETRINVAFTPHHSLETYLQPLLSSADYGSAKQLVAERTYDFVPYAGAVPNLDFNLRSLRGDAVLRWEWRQGSTMYLVWQQSRFAAAGVGDFDFDRDRQALFSTRPDDIFLVKVNFWVNP